MDNKDRESIQAVLEIMRRKMKDNIKKMEENNKESSNIIQMESPSSNRSKLVNGYSMRNSELTKENNELLKIHSDIIRYLNTYVNVASREEEYVEEFIDEDFKISSLSVDDVFNMTIKGEIKIDENYPLLKDKDFMETIFEYFISQEMYEECGIISALIR